MSFLSSSTAKSHLATAKTVLSAAATMAATVMVVRSVVHDLLPTEIHDYIVSRISNIFSSELTFVFEEFEGLKNNKIFKAAKTYLGTKTSPSTHRIRVSKSNTDKSFTLSMELNQIITDNFNGVKLNWILVCRHVKKHSRSFHNPRDMNSTLKSEVRSLELTFHKKHKDMVLNTYLPFILKEAKSKKQENKALRIFTIDNRSMYAWVGTTLDHPATFDTLALDRSVREFVMEDLKRFLKRKEYYRKVGKVWKRGYLLYGPPGTGKSSLIAAMANYLRFDVYDLEFTELRSNSQLRRMLMAMAKRSILVVEDIDSYIEFQDRLAESRALVRNDNKQVTLSGLLNFIDGLWSSCGDERIIVFVTNHKEKLDPALLRPGRMDVHIHMSYCTPCGFRDLASTYLGIKEHVLFGEIEEAIQKTQVTPAEVAEQLLKSNDNETTLKELVVFLGKKKESKKPDVKKGEREFRDKEEQQKKEEDDGDKGEKVDNIAAYTSPRRLIRRRYTCFARGRGRKITVIT